MPVKKNLEVLHPVAEEKQSASNSAARLPGIKGKKIGLFWNSKAGGDIALNEVSRILQTRFEGVEFADFLWPKFTHSGPDFMAKVLESKCDAVVGSTGD
jgi:hypothetical protein